MGTLHKGKWFEKRKIKEVITTAMQIVQAKAEEKKIGIELDCPVETFAKIDSTLLDQALVNLLDNAIKYTPAGGRVGVTVQSDGNHGVSLVIKDTGIGISENDRSRIFERFYRCDPSRSEAGIGLGLSFAQTIARAHGGDITVASQLDEGSTFTITLPKKGL